MPDFIYVSVHHMTRKDGRKHARVVARRKGKRASMAFDYKLDADAGNCYVRNCQQAARLLAARLGLRFDCEVGDGWLYLDHNQRRRDRYTVVAA